PPLQRDQWLDPRLAALAERDRMPIRLALDEQAALLDPRENSLLGLLLAQARELPGLVAHPAVGADHGQLGQLVVAPDLEVHRVVPRRHLQRAGAELGVD